MITKQQKELFQSLREQGNKVIHLDWSPDLSISPKGEITWIAIVGHGRRLSKEKLKSLKLLQAVGMKIQLYKYVDKSNLTNKKLETLPFDPEDVTIVITEDRGSQNYLSRVKKMKGTHFKRVHHRLPSLHKMLEQQQSQKEILKQFQVDNPYLGKEAPLFEREPTDQEDYDQITSLLSNLAKQTLHLEEEDSDVSKPPLEETKE